VLALLPSAFCLLILSACHREVPRYSVLLITLDTTRADHINGNTPTLLALQRSGVSFANADSPVPLTLPAHSSILSGVIPPHHGLRNNGGGTFPAGRDTLATNFQRTGYRTGAFVGSFVLDHRFGLDRGFDMYDDEIARDPDAEESMEAERRGSVVVDRALAWLHQPDGRPFFAWVHLYDPHAPYAPPAPYPQTYDGELAYTDAQVARLLATIDRQHTVVAVVGDHGEALGEHGELTHGLLLYEPTLHVPMIVAMPNGAPRVIQEPVSTVDLAPTLAVLAGVPMSGPLDGQSLETSVRKGDVPHAANIYAETEYPVQFGWSELTSMRAGNLKLIRASRAELYDLTRDPRETVNELDTERRTYGDLMGRLDAIASTAIKATASGLDEETRSKLASLGYVAPSGNATAPRDGARAGPAQMIPLFRKFEEGRQLLQRQRGEEARRVLEEIVAADPRNAVFRASLAHAWRQEGNLARAIDLYREAIAETPDDPEAWYNLATAFQEGGDQARAAEAIRAALARDERRPEAHNVLGIALTSAGKFDDAQREFERALAIDPLNARACNNLGNIDRSRGRPEDAEAAYRKAIALAPRYADPLNGLGALLVQANRPRDALPLLDRAIALSPNFYEARLNRAIALAVAGERTTAARELEALLRATSGHPAADPQRAAARQLLDRLRGLP
jgi:arylsulfatase A-like enzyme/Tfp pilus assembly protein PilF